MRSIYLDYAATTPVDKRVYKKMIPYLSGKKGFFGNPHSLHRDGQRAFGALDHARDIIAQHLTAHHRDILFTGSATEANNLAIRGVFKGYFRNRKSCTTIPEIIVSSIEHPSVLETVKDLERDGSAKIHYLGVGREGVVDINELKNKLSENTILVSVMWANNETGVIQPIEKIGAIIHEYKSSRAATSENCYPIFHTDAVQALQYFDLNVIKSRVDAMTLSAHKIYGPKGVGCLYLRHDYHNVLAPIITGGGQENQKRSGTQNVAGIVGFAHALQVCAQERKTEHKRQAELSAYCFHELKKHIPDIEINGELEQRSPHILNIYIPRLERPVVALDSVGLLLSSGSACAGRRIEISHVLRAMGYSDERILRSVRISIGRPTKRGDVLVVIKRITRVLKSRTEK